MTLADPDRRSLSTGEIQWVVVPVAKDFIACVADMTPGSAREVRAGKIEPPKKTRDVRPIYPIAAQQ